MKKQIICVLVAILIASIQNESAAQKIKLLKKTHLTDYPSASSLEFYKDKLYVVGDDAPTIRILDKEHRFLDSIVLFSSAEKRIHPAEKADLESSTIFSANNHIYLISFSSFSSGKRNKIIFSDLSGNKKNTIVEGDLSNIKVAELNIEGATIYKDKLLLSNRANTTHKNNSLILAAINFATGIEPKNNSIITLQLPKTKKIIGVSGMYYVEEKDLMLFTASTEDTPNAVLDGTIGNSYLGYIKNFSKKLNRGAIKATKLTSIFKYLQETTPQKIESITVEKIMGKKAIVHLAADNDNGESTLFKLRVKL